MGVGMGQKYDIDPMQFAPDVSELTEQEYRLRVDFAKIYRRTRNGRATCLELGIHARFCDDWAQYLLDDPLVVRLLAEKIKDETTEEERSERRKVYVAWLENQANYYGHDSSHSARISAIKMLLDLNEPEDKTQTTLPNVILVPQWRDVDDWEKSAVESQDKLKQAVKQ